MQKKSRLISVKRGDGILPDAPAGSYEISAVSLFRGRPPLPPLIFAAASMADGSAMLLIHNPVTMEMICHGDSLMVIYL